MLRRGLALSLLALAACAPTLEAPREPQAPLPVAGTAPGGVPLGNTAPAGGAQAPVPAGNGALLASPLPPSAPSAAPIAAPPPADAAASADDEMALDEELDDGEDEGTAIAAPSAPVISVSDGELKRRFHDERASLGSISVGRAHAGLLFNGVQMPRSERWVLLDPSRAYGTKETVDALAHCIDKVNEKLPGAPPIPIGHISAQHGGHLSPHLSHQSGRDVDIGYYFKGGPARQFIRATESNLDLARTWALVKAALKETTVEMIFIDTSIQRPLAHWAAANGEDPAYVDEVFQVRGKNAAAPIRHVKGHHNHIHFRFHSPLAEELGRRVASYVVIPKPVAVARRGNGPAEGAPAHFVMHKARSGDTLVNLAKHYGTTIEEIQRANSLKGIALKIGVSYRIPSKAPPKPATPTKVAAVAKKGASKPAPARGNAAPAR